MSAGSRISLEFYRDLYGVENATTKTADALGLIHIVVSS
jgi:hypothetical protein